MTPLTNDQLDERRDLYDMYEDRDDPGEPRYTEFLAVTKGLWEKRMTSIVEKAAEGGLDTELLPGMEWEDIRPTIEMFVSAILLSHGVGRAAAEFLADPQGFAEETVEMWVDVAGGEDELIKRIREAVCTKE